MQQGAMLYRIEAPSDVIEHLGRRYPDAFLGETGIMEKTAYVGSFFVSQARKIRNEGIGIIRLTEDEEWDLYRKTVTNGLTD